MSIWIISLFTQNGNPKTGLSPTVNVRDISDGSLIVTAGAMSEIGDGLYKYEFSAYDNTKSYSIRCDGGSSLGDNERYTYSTNNNLIDSTLALLDNKYIINEATSELWLYDATGASVIKKWPLTDKDDNSISLTGTGPASRGQRTV